MNGMGDSEVLLTRGWMDGWMFWIYFYILFLFVGRDS
jgi:hypothetical protein